MAVIVIKNPQESPERLIARFNKKVQQSRILILTRAKRYRKKKPTARLVRRAALKREQYRAERQKSKFV
jgi:ribosomal protein S21